MASLFERLEPDGPLRRHLTREQLARQQVEAIKQHVEYLLNARRGCSQSSPELGLSDFNGGAIGTADLVIHISADIRRSVEAFEPRIKVRSVRYQPNPQRPLELSFRLDCQVRLNNKEELVQLTVAMHGQGRRYTRVT
ncbi:MAG: type VI secretion system baseplate subunit TssE [Pseudomonas sp.]|nr:type VI secretion system baseplate subunit TssE [Pseudomonas sp.]